MAKVDIRLSSVLFRKFPNPENLCRIEKKYFYTISDASNPIRRVAWTVL